MTKKYSIFLTVLFCAFIGGVFLISLLLPKKRVFPPGKPLSGKAPPS